MSEWIEKRALCEMLENLGDRAACEYANPWTWADALDAVLCSIDELETIELDGRKEREP